MTEYVFLDTAALVALMNKKDQYHVQAVNKLDAHLKGSGQLLSTPHVFAETVTRILRGFLTQKPSKLEILYITNRPLK